MIPHDELSVGGPTLSLLDIHKRGKGSSNMATHEATKFAGAVIPQSKETKLKLRYVCPGSYITYTVTHHGKTDAMFNYLNRVLFSYINDPGSQKDYRAAISSSLSIVQLP
jgi:hypothetical protein